MWKEEVEFMVQVLAWHHSNLLFQDLSQVPMIPPLLRAMWTVLIFKNETKSGTSLRRKCVEKELWKRSRRWKRSCQQLVAFNVIFALSLTALSQ